MMFHEYLPGTQDYASLYLKQSKRSQSGLKLTQSYWIKLTNMLMDPRKLCIITSDRKKAPRERFTEFLHFIACKNTNKSEPDEELGGAQLPFYPGLNSNHMLTNVFACFANCMEKTILS